MTSDEALSTVGVGESSSSVDTNVSWPESPPPPVPERLTEVRSNYSKKSDCDYRY